MYMHMHIFLDLLLLILIKMVQLLKFHSKFTTTFRAKKILRRSEITIIVIYVKNKVKRSKSRNKKRRSREKKHR